MEIIVGNSKNTYNEFDQWSSTKMLGRFLQGKRSKSCQTLPEFVYLYLFLFPCHESMVGIVIKLGTYLVITTVNKP